MTARTWEIVPGNTVSGLLLGLLVLYLAFRHVLLVLMVMDLMIARLRLSGWFPKEGKRLSTCVHWLIALALFAAYFPVAKALGWLDHPPL